MTSSARSRALPVENQRPRWLLTELADRRAQQHDGRRQHTARRDQQRWFEPEHLAKQPAQQGPERHGAPGYPAHGGVDPSLQVILRHGLAKALLIDLVDS